MKPCNVLILDNEFNVGGVEKKLVEFIERADRSRYHMAVCCLKQGGYYRARLESIGVPFYDGLLHHRFDFGVYSRLLDVIRREAVDVIYTFVHPNTVILANLARMQGRVKRFAVSFHAIGGRDGGPLVPHYLRPLVNQADALVALGETHRRYLVASERADNDLFQLIPNGVDTGRYRPARNGEATAKRLELELPADAIVATHVASIKPLKNHEWLIRSVAQRMRADSRIHIVLVGDGPLRETIERLVAALELESQVRLLGNRDDVDAILRASDFVVLPSRTEVFPNVVLEALASGIPVIATDVGCVRDMVEDGESGAVIATDDSVALGAAFDRFVSDADFRRRCGAAGRKLVEENFPLQLMVDRRQALFDRLMVDAGARRK